MHIDKIHLMVVDLFKSSCNKIDIIVLINNIYNAYMLEIVNEDFIRGVDFKNNWGLADILVCNGEKSRYFISLIFAVYDNKKLTLPIDLGYFMIE
ncbi:hypothetical protein [Chamaesiphon sp.]|uniref:hypothetical protein n=1 Tax=Chamaesiphon sp. TaxID=2814140 RepID=UPI00359372F4